MDTLYLTKEELMLWEALPQSVRDRVEADVTEEVLDAYETEEELLLRMDMLQKNEELQPYVQAIEDAHQAKPGQDPFTDDVFDAFPTEQLPEVLFSMGACGICLVVELMLQRDEFTQEDTKSLLYLSNMRHLILESNAHTVPTSV